MTKGEENIKKGSKKRKKDPTPGKVLKVCVWAILGGSAAGTGPLQIGGRNGKWIGVGRSRFFLRNSRTVVSAKGENPVTKGTTYLADLTEVSLDLDEDGKWA